MYTCFQVRCGYSCHIWTKLEFSRQIFENCSNIKCNENPSRGNRVGPMSKEERTN